MKPSESHYKAFWYGWDPYITIHKCMRATRLKRDGGRPCWVSWVMFSLKRGWSAWVDGEIVVKKGKLQQSFRNSLSVSHSHHWLHPTAILQDSPHWGCLSFRAFEELWDSICLCAVTWCCAIEAKQSNYPELNSPEHTLVSVIKASSLGQVRRQSLGFKLLYHFQKTFVTLVFCPWLCLHWEAWKKQKEAAVFIMSTSYSFISNKMCLLLALVMW